MSNHVEHQTGLDALEPYVPGTPIEEVQRKYGLDDVIKLASNENPLGPSPKAVEAMRDALCKVNLYPDGQSYYLRQALGSFLELEPDHVTVGNGADGIIMQTCMAYLDQDDEVVVSASSFPVYDIYSHVMRAKLVKTPLKDYGIDLGAMLEAMTPRTRLVFVCNPNNPTGTIVNAAEVSAFMEQVPDHVLVVFDEAYYEMVDLDDYPETIGYVREGRPNVMVMRTFSKAFGLAGIRLGYAMGVPKILGPLNRVKEPFAVNLLAQAAGLAALEDADFLRETIETTQRERRFLRDGFGKLGLETVPSQTNFMLVRFGTRAGEVQEALLRRGVIVRPCTGYDLPDFLRITVGSREQNERLLSEVEALLSEEDSQP